MLAHAEWIERAMHNGVLGTQRGVQPGAMVYMMPQVGLTSSSYHLIMMPQVGLAL